MADQWHYSKEGQQFGPVPLEVLKSLLSSGQLQPTDLVWTEGMAEWAAANTVPQLSGSTPSAAAPPPKPAPQSASAPPPKPTAGAPVDMTPQGLMERFGLEGILVGAGSLVTLISTFLPWYSFLGLTALGIQGGPGGFSMLLAIGSGVCLAIFNFVQGMKDSKQKAMIFSIVFTAAGGLVALCALSVITGVPGFGAFLGFLGGGAICGGGVMHILKANKMA